MVPRRWETAELNAGVSGGGSSEEQKLAHGTGENTDTEL